MRRSLVPALALVLLGAAPVRAADGPGRLAVAARAGTAGLGAELSARLGTRAAARVFLAGLSVSDTYDDTGIRYDAELRLAHLGVLLDLHPAGSGFRISAGALLDDDRLEVEAPLTELLLRERPDLPIQGLDLGEAVGTAEVDTVVPYAGIGWGGAHGPRGRWYVAFDLGAAYLGSPDVTLEARTTVPIDEIPGATELLAQLIADEERRLEAELADYRWLPVVSIGVGYRF